MLKFKRVFALIVLFFLLTCSSVLATDNTSLDETLVTTTAKKPITAQTINEDCYIYERDSYTLDNIIYGNVFASTTKFNTNPRNGGGIINGDLFLISTEATINSDVIYSNNQDTNGNYIISAINSRSIINGNVYILADNFTLSAGSEIHGDLYVAAQSSVKVDQDAIIDGNIFITSSNVTINGKVTGSAYITTENFNMNYFTYITKDLYLNAGNAKLSGIIYRNAFITANSLQTIKGFRVNGNLSVDFVNDFTFSGEVYGDAQINATTLNFKKDEETKCEIGGNLKYGTKNECKIPDGIVKGSVSTEKYIDKTSNKFKFSEFVLSWITLVVYVLVIVLLARAFAKGAIAKLPTFNTKNTLISFGIGFLSFIAIIILFVLLAVLVAGIYVAFALLIAYLFVLAIAVPLFIYQIANCLKVKWNISLKVFLVTTLFYLVKFVPVLGSLVVFIIFTAGVGQILLGLVKKN